MDDELFVAFEAPTENQQAVLRYFDEAPLTYDVLHTGEQSVLLQYEMPVIPPPIHAVLASGNLVQFPLTLRDGWITFDLTTSHERLSRLKAEFEDAGFTYEVVSVTQSTQPTDLLTDRQRRFMIEALQRGYYDSPRECSLTDLAAGLDVGKSTVSRVLHNAEEKIIKKFFAEPIE
ncbi:helix-turn-helix domain-containing protein [Halococcus sediminicola]|uniref:helix-turn-helix domain-containing protein n=1 Tax=Halococcus sediminicola TaxID=1264579 RepID=UPI000AADEB95|nr:helix-turn-helix domain-containing protein [Halococcus sediminicola]